MMPWQRVLVLAIVLLGVLASCGPGRAELEEQERAIWTIVLDEVKTFDDGGFLLFERSDNPRGSVETALKLGLVWEPWGEELTRLAREIEAGSESISMAVFAEEYGCGLVDKSRIDEATRRWNEAWDAGHDLHESVAAHIETFGAKVSVHLSRVAFKGDRALVHYATGGAGTGFSGYMLLERGESGWFIVKRINLSAA